MATITVNHLFIRARDLLARAQKCAFSQIYTTGVLVPYASKCWMYDFV